MALCDFYALGEDLRQLFLFLYSETDIIAYEMYSDPGREPRQFRSLAEIESVYSLGAYRAAYLQLWSPTVSALPVIRRIAIQHPAPTRRYAVEGAGLIQLYLDGIKDGIIHHTHFGHWNEAGARQRCIHPADDCDWRALGRLSRKIQSHIRLKLAKAMLYARPFFMKHLVPLTKATGSRSTTSFTMRVLARFGDPALRTHGKHRKNTW
jgi:hypothetical protein